MILLPVLLMGAALFILLDWETPKPYRKIFSNR